MDIGNQISTLRKSHGLSQEQMAAHFHVSRQTVSNWENNRHYPDLATLVRISEDFHISLDQLLKDDRAFVAENDAQRKKGRQQSFLIALLLLLGLLLSGTIWRITTAFRPTADNQRISTEISLKMWVNLPGQSPSRAITQTFSAESFDTRSDSEQKHLLTAVTGRIEGDIPAISQTQRDKPVSPFFFRTGIIRISFPGSKALRSSPRPDSPLSLISSPPAGLTLRQGISAFQQRKFFALSALCRNDSLPSPALS